MTDPASLNSLEDVIRWVIRHGTQAESSSVSRAAYREARKTWEDKMDTRMTQVEQQMATFVGMVTDVEEMKRDVKSILRKTPPAMPAVDLDETSPRRPQPVDDGDSHGTKRKIVIGTGIGGGSVALWEILQKLLELLTS